MLSKRRMAQNPPRNTPANSNSNALHLEMGSPGPSGLEDPLKSGEQVSVPGDDFSDGSYALYNLYNEKTAEFDRELVNNWMEHVRDLMILSGLISAAIAAFLAQSYLSGLTGPQDVSAYYLQQAYLLQVTLSNTTPQDIPPDEESAPFSTNILWFLGLGTSLSSAALAMLLQSWLRRYVVMTQTQQSPRGRALIRAYVAYAGLLNPLQLTLDFLHLLLDVAIFTFLAGLITLLFVTAPDDGSFATIFLIAYILSSLYLALSWRSVLFHTIYSTPLARVLRHIKQLVKIIIPRKSFFKSFLGHKSNPLLSYDWVTLDRLDQVPEQLTKMHGSSLNNEIIACLLHSFHHDHGFEHFLECIPRFYDSDLVEKPKEIFHDFHKDQVPREILSFIHRTSSSATLPHEVKKRRIGISLQVMELDPYLLERTFFHTITLPAKQTVFRCVDFVLSADRFSRRANEGPEAQLFAKCIIAVAISHVTSQELIDERWTRVIECWLPFPIPTFDANPDGQLASMKLDNLVSLVGVLRSADLQYSDKITPRTLSAACNFSVENVASESRSQFCDLWNQLRESASAVPASLILPNIYTIYNILHGGTTDSPINQALSPSNYPSCTDPTHRPTTRQGITPVTNAVMAN